MHEPALQKAFGTFSLNGMNPYHWRFLLGILATAVFGKAPKKEPKPRRPIGRPRKWTEEKRAILARRKEIVDLFVAAFKGDWRPTKIEISEIIRAGFPEEYRHGDEKRIAREIAGLREK